MHLGHRLLCCLALQASCGLAAPAPAPWLLDDTRPLPPGLVGAGRQPSSGAAPHRLFLQLEGALITRAQASDAPANLSYLCGNSFPAWQHQPFGTDRAAAIEQLRARVQALFVDFNLEVITLRPASPPYTMLVVGGTAPLCGLAEGYGGLAPLDCGNQILSDVGFVFAAAITHLEGLAVTIAHEAGHSFGLPHTSEACDLMSSAWCSGGSKTFLDAEMSVWPDASGSCGLQVANSWQLLRQALGPRPTVTADSAPAADRGGPEAAAPGDAAGEPGPASAGGCGLVIERDTLTRPSLLLWAPLLLLLPLLWSLLPGRRRGDGT